MNDQVAEDIIAMVAAEPGITLAALIDGIPGASISSLGRLIAKNEVYVDLRVSYLGDTETVRVFANKTIASFFERLSETQVREVSEKGRANELVPGTSLLWDGIRLQIVHVGKTEISLQRDNREYLHFPIEDFQRFINEGRVTGFVLRTQVKAGMAAYELAKHIQTHEEMVEALQRYEIIKPRLNGQRVTSQCNVTDRTIRTWIKAYKTAELKSNNGLLGLISRNKEKGNSNDRLDAQTKSLMDQAIKSDYGTDVKKTKTLVFGFFQNLCIAAGILKPPTYKTFIKRIKALLDGDMIEKRDGSKAAYQSAEFLERVDTEIPIHGDRPWEKVHIDHTELDEELLHSLTKKNMGKAWLTLMIDSCTRRVLAHYLTYDPPSYRSLLGVMRECVRRHGRLPESVIIDGGSDLQSIYFENLCAGFYVDIIRRPPTKPRFGAIIERFIHTMNKQFVHNLRGNTKVMKNARQTTPAVNPKKLTVWDLPMLDKALSQYLFEEYENREHSLLGMSPREAYDTGMAKYDLPNIPIPYDESFIMDTLPSTRSGFATIRRQRGIQIFGSHYKANELRDPELYGTKVPLRYDPYNMAVVYAYVRNKWVVCLAPPRIFLLLKNHSEREMKLIFEEERQRCKAYGRKFNNRAREMALHQADREQSEAVAAQRLRDEELRKTAPTRGNQHSTVSHNDSQSKIDVANQFTQEGANNRRRSNHPKVFRRAKKAA